MSLCRFRLRTAQILIGLFLITTSLSLLAETEPRTESIKSALHEFLAGAGANDAAVHDRFWSEDLIYTSSSGERFGKQTIMAGFENSDTAVDDASLSYSAAQINISFVGDLALLTFQLVAEPAGDPDSIQRYFNSGVLRNIADDGAPPHWQALLWQATRIPDASLGDAPD